MALPTTRRRFLITVGSATAAGVLASCGGKATALIRACDPAVARSDAQRRKPGARILERQLVAAPLTVDLAGRQAATWAYGGMIPGPELRARVG